MQTWIPPVVLEEVEHSDSAVFCINQLDFPHSATPNVSSNHLKVGHKYIHILHISFTFQVVAHVKEEEEGERKRQTAQYHQHQARGQEVADL